MIDWDAVKASPRPYEVLVAHLQTYFPTPAIPPSSVAVWAADLSRYDLEVVAEAIETLGHFGTRGRPLQYADIEAVCEDIFRTRLRLSAPPLPPGEFREAAPEEVREILDGYWSRIGDERRFLAHARSGRESADPARRVEAVRRLAAARIETEGNRESPQARPHPVGEAMRTACGAVVGTHAVERDGRWCCPNCGAPIDEGCVGGAA